MLFKGERPGAGRVPYEHERSFRVRMIGCFRHHVLVSHLPYTTKSKISLPFLLPRPSTAKEDVAFVVLRERRNVTNSYLRLSQDSHRLQDGHQFAFPLTVVNKKILPSLTGKICFSISADFMVDFSKYSSMGNHSHLPVGAGFPPWVRGSEGSTSTPEGLHTHSACEELSSQLFNTKPSLVICCLPVRRQNVSREKRWCPTF